MRFLKLFLSLFASLAVLIVVAYWVWDYGGLVISTLLFQIDASRVIRITNSVQNEHKAYCHTGMLELYSGKIPDNQLKHLVKGYQLRFVNSSTYKIEMVCGEERLQPLELKSAQLWGGIEKSSGSGLIALVDPESELDGNDQMVVLANKRSKVGLSKNDDTVKILWFIRDSDIHESLTIGPVTTCEGYGGVCCGEPYQVGSGSAFLKNTTCGISCYSVCRPRPSVVYLNTNPLLDPTGRFVTLTMGQTLSIGYEITGIQVTGGNAFIDFGDGKKQRLTKAKDILEHTYDCALGECQYTLRLTAWDEFGVELSESRLNSLTLKVTQ